MCVGGCRSSLGGWLLGVALSGAVAASAVASSSDGLGAVPEGLVTFFEGESCPAGWDEATFARGRALLFTEDPRRVRKQWFRALTQADVEPHSHQLSVSVDLEPNTFTGADGCSNPKPQPGTYTGGGHTGPAQSALPLAFLRACVAPAAQGESGLDPLPFATFAFFDRQSCPRGWSPSCPECPRLGGRFALPVMDGGQVGLEVAQPWVDPTRVGTHAHSLSGSTLLWTDSILAADGANRRGKGGRVQFRGATLFPNWSRDSQGLLPYVELLGCTKTAFRQAGEVPKGLTILFGGEESCPDERWRETRGTAGKFLVAASPNLPPGSSNRRAPYTNGEDRRHQHTFEAKLNVAGESICIADGCFVLCREHFARPTSELVGGNTNHMPMGVPYVQLRHCTYLGGEPRSASAR